MTVAEAMISTQEAVASLLTGSTSLMGLVSGVYDYYTDKVPGYPYIVFGPITPDYERVAGETNGTRSVFIVLTLWVFDDAPSKLPTLQVLREVELALDTTPTLSYGIAAAPPDIIIRGAELDEGLGLWRTPVEVRLLVVNI